MSLPEKLPSEPLNEVEGNPHVQGTDGPKVVNFEDLARCGNEVWIRNGGQLYRLQQTRQGKLILTK
jgi:hemin uptake protein HemP